MADYGYVLQPFILTCKKEVKGIDIERDQGCIVLAIMSLRNSTFIAEEYFCMLRRGSGPPCLKMCCFVS